MNFESRLVGYDELPVLLDASDGKVLDGKGLGYTSNTGVFLTFMACRFLAYAIILHVIYHDYILHIVSVSMLRAACLTCDRVEWWDIFDQGPHDVTCERE